MPIKINAATLKKILAKFGYADQVKQIFPTETGYRNSVFPIELESGQKLALIFYKAEPNILTKIKLSNQVSNFLAEQNWPVRHTCQVNQRTILQLGHQNKLHYCCLYNYLPGATINWADYSMKHIKLLGQVLGHLHHDLKKFTIANEEIYNPEILNLESKIITMNKYFCDTKIVLALEQKLKLALNQATFKQFKKLMSQQQQLPHQQWLHMDFVRSNLLFEHHTAAELNATVTQDKFSFPTSHASAPDYLTISGILDFEKTAFGSPILDLARTLAFLLVDCKDKSEPKIIKYFIYSGYHKRGTQPLPDMKLVMNFTQFFLFYDFYKFLCHNPYQSLPLNEHFVRTRDYLLNQGLIFSHN